MDSLIQKALALSRLTAKFPVDTIFSATVWLEEKHHKAPDSEATQAIVLHYLVLALRQDTEMESAIAQGYCARAARWQAAVHAGEEDVPLGKTFCDN
jgi:hypothetical protein